MKLDRIATEGEHGYPGVDLRGFSRGLTLITGESQRELSSLAGLTAHLLLGIDPTGGAPRHWIRGDVYVSTSSGAIRLSRRGTPDTPQLTAARREGVGSEAANPAAWRAGIPLRVAATILFGRGDDDPRVDLERLLAPEVAVEIRRLLPSEAPSVDDSELLRRRDELVMRIESRLGEQRGESERLETRLAELQQLRETLAQEREELRASLHATDSELGADESRRRYDELARIAEEAEGRRSADGWTPRVEDLDGQIARWRTTLAELEQREAYILDRLAGVRPDDASPEVTLADQRASIAVAQRLVVDLESEVARFARTGDSPLCVCRDAHPRLNPLVETLGKHITLLTDLVAQLDRALHSQELIDESDQIARSKEEIRRQIDKLLGRRETLWRTTRARATRVEEPDVPRIDLATLESDRADLARRLGDVETRLQRVDAEIADLSERRRGLYEPAELSGLRDELSKIESRLGCCGKGVTLRGPAPLRASDVLAKLTDGELVELRLTHGGRACEVRTRGGGAIAQQSLTEEQLRAIVAALRIALADTLAAARVETPLVLDHPFARMSERLAANLATALDDYRRRERQAIVFLGSGVAAARFRSLGVDVRSLREVTVTETKVTPPAVEAKRVVRTETSRYVLEIDDPIERFPVPIEGREEAFRRARITTVRDLVTADPSAVADELGLSDVSAELVSLWQAHSALVCFVPGLTFAEAKALAAAGVLTVVDLSEADADELSGRLNKGRIEWRSSRSIADWIELSSDGVGRWRSSGLSEAWSRSGRERRTRITENAGRRRRTTRRSRSDSSRTRQSSRTRESSGTRGSRRSTRTTRTRRVRESSARAETTVRYYLDAGDDIESAPSIGAKLAERLRGQSIVRVRDLLEADPETVASRLDDSRFDASTIVAWQHQAGLMCRVAGLRGHDAQILVACGFTNAEEIATMKPADLLEFVDPFCDGAEAKRILRGSSRPDLEEVTSWIEGARRRRTLETA